MTAVPPLPLAGLCLPGNPPFADTREQVRAADLERPGGKPPVRKFFANINRESEWAEVSATPTGSPSGPR